MSTLENANWTPIYIFNSCEKRIEVFQSMFSTAINSCLPMRSVKTFTRDKPWITPDIRICIKKRQLAWVRNDVEQYKIYRNKVAKPCKFSRWRFYEDKIRYTNDINPKKWWDNIKMLSGLSCQQSLTSNACERFYTQKRTARRGYWRMFLSCVQRYNPFGLPTYSSYKRS